MEFITESKSLEGKTIKTVNLMESLNIVNLIFTDNTCVFIDIAYDGSFNRFKLLPSKWVEPFIQERVGIITEDEFNIMEAKEEKECEERVKRQDLDTFNRIKEKYNLYNL